MVHRIHCGDVSEQHLRGADITIGLLAADMLFASLQRHAERLLAAGIDRNANDATWHRTFKFIFCREIGGMGAAIAHRHAEALGAAEHDICTHLARGF